MYISHLSLLNFRNYGHLELELPAGPVVFQGANAQGKTNLLEAIFLLATARSLRATHEGELITWNGGEECPGARLWAKVHKAGGELEVEVVLQVEKASPQPQEPGEHPLPAGSPDIRKRVRVNGLARRAIDLVGQVNVVMFSVQDVDLVSGPPGLRRRYLDIVLCQMDRRYGRSLQRYQKVLSQRNHLLRLLSQGQAQMAELTFWDRELAEHGSYITQQRGELVSALKPLAQGVHGGLTQTGERLELVYLPNLGKAPETGYSALLQAFHQALPGLREREVASGMSLLGPHRDDLHFLVNGINMGVYGSRGQHRGLVLSLKLAEAELMDKRLGDSPILLLDDVLSEMDGPRRQQLLKATAGYSQVLITATDLFPFPRDYLSGATKFQVRQGAIHPTEA